MIEAIIYDMDGTLVDSQPLQYQAYRLAFAKSGYNLTQEDWRQYVTNSLSTDTFIEKRGLAIDPMAVRSTKRPIYDNLILTALELMPGAREIIDYSSQRYRLCVASASRSEDIHAVMNKFGLATRFEQLISDESVKRAKPFPDVFLKTAELMDVLPAECLVIEDSVAGLKAAKAAGMGCIVCPDKSYNTPLSEYDRADHIINTLYDIINLKLL